MLWLDVGCCASSYFKYLWLHISSDPDYCHYLRPSPPSLNYIQMETVNWTRYKCRWNEWVKYIIWASRKAQSCTALSWPRSLKWWLALKWPKRDILAKIKEKREQGHLEESKDDKKSRMTIRMHLAFWPSWLQVKRVSC